MVDQPEVVASLKRSLQTASIPHLLMYGPAGVGKTSAALALVRDLFGPERYRSRLLELNASHERGIAVIRNKVKGFAARAIDSSQNDARYPSPPLKFILLDEVDNLSNDAMSALRRVMEKYSTVTRFILVCNYVSAIAAPIVSRCSKFRFTPLPRDATIGRLRAIAEAEDIDISEGGVDKLVEVSSGDLRKSITLLQSCKRLVVDGVVDEHVVSDCAGEVPIECAWRLLVAATSGAFGAIQKEVENVVAEGFPADQVLFRLQEVVLAPEHVQRAATRGGAAAGAAAAAAAAAADPDGESGVVVAPLSQAEILQRIAVVDGRLNEGADEYLQLLDVVAHIGRTLQRQ